MIFTPESPAWLAKNGQLSKAEASFLWCRGDSDEAKNELVVMLERNQSKSTNSKIKLEDFLVPEFLKPLGILTVFIVANQWSGVNAITFYTVTIIKETIGDGVNEYLSMLLVDIVRVLISIWACILLKKHERRRLAIVSGAGTFLTLFTLGLFTLLVKWYPEVSTAVYVPMTALILYIAFISIGFVPLPWAMIGEVFPLKTRSIGSGITSFLAFTAFFSVVKTSPAMFRDLGSDITFIIYSVVALCGTIFVFCFLPETKDRPLHEIGDDFKRKGKKSEAPSV